MSYIPASLKDLLDAVRKILVEEIIPVERTWRHCHFSHILPILKKKQEQIKALGYWTPQVPRSFGGMGLNLEKMAQLSELLGHSPFGHFVFNCQSPDAGNMDVLMAHGTPEQQQLFLRPLLQGSVRSCFAVSEPDQPGSNPVLANTMAVPDRDEYILNGHKWFVAGADGASFAIVMAVTHPNAPNPYNRFSLFIVPTNTNGFHRIRNISVMGDEEDDWMSHSEIRLEDCRVPKSFILGAPGGGFKIVQDRLGPERISHCMRWIGICERAFDMMCRRAMNRELKPGILLSSQQSIQNFIAESRAEIDATRLLVMDAARKIDKHGIKEVRLDLSLIKFYTTRTLQNVIDRAIQVHGALGVSDDTLLAYWYRHERASRIYDGPDEVHKSRAAHLILKNFE